MVYHGYHRVRRGVIYFNLNAYECAFIQHPSCLLIVFFLGLMELLVFPLSYLSLSLSTSFLTSLVFAVVLSPCLVSSPEVLITQANAVKLRHCPAVIRWRSNKASHSIIVILI